MRSHALVLTALFLPVLAHAAPRMVVVAAGQCHQGDLLALTRQFAEVLSTRGPGLAGGTGDVEWVREDALRRQVGSGEIFTPAQLTLRLNAAQTSFYNGTLRQTDAQLETLLQQIATLPPSAERVKLASDAHVLRAMTLRNLDRAAEGDEELRAVLRIQSSFSLDADNYAPQLRARVDRLRSDLAREAKAQLRLTSEPSGAQVYIDGQLMGRTPLQLDLVPASYEVRMKQGDRFSFSHELPLEHRRPVTLRVDAEFEGALDLHAAPCLENDGAELPLQNAVKLGGLVEVEDVVLVRVEAPPGGARWLTASLIQTDSAQRVREGGIKLEPSTEAQLAGMQELAHFIVTGQAGRRVQALELPRAALPPPSVAAPNRNPPGGPGPSWKKPTAIAAAVAAGGAATVGVLLTLHSAANWTQFNAFYPNATTAPTADQLSTVATYKRQALSDRTWSFVSYGSAAVAAAASITLFILDARDTGSHAPGSATAVRVEPVVSPMSIGLVGRF